jgi:indolepyruvate ferredoxin oxidoreductase beta subunit
MNYDLVICGVGGQGVLSIAWVIDHAAHEAGLHFKQSEVHGMAQRGGAVSACVRLSDQPLASDLIATGEAALVLSVEPLEALRYTKLLSPGGWIVSDITPMVNIPDYPATERLYPVLFSAPQLVALDATQLARKAGNIKAQNMVALGAAARLLPLPVEALERQIAALFAAKGERIVKANLNAFRMGDAASGFARALREAGVPGDLVAQVVSRIQFAPHPVGQDEQAAWRDRLLAADAAEFARRLFDSGQWVKPDGLAGVPALV